MYESPTGILLPDNYKLPEEQIEIQRPISLSKAIQAIPTLPQIGKPGYNPYKQSWQLNYLRNAVAHEYCYIHSPWVWTCVEAITQSCTMDQYSIETEDENIRHAMEIFLYNIAQRSSFDRLLRGIYRDLLINGNWYGLIGYFGKKPCSISRINFKQIVPDVPDDGSGNIKSYSIYPQGFEGRPMYQIQAKDILHFTSNDMGDNGTGLSQLECLDMTLALERYSLEYQNGFFVNGVKAGDVYSSDGSMSPEAYARDKIYLESYTASDKAYAPLFLSGNWKLISRGQEMRKDADFLALRNWLREEVLSVFSVPMSMVSTDKVGTLGSNGKEEDRELFMNAVVAPLQKQVFEDFNRQFIIGVLGNDVVRLLPPGRPRIRLNDVQAAVEMTKAGFTGNEIRSALNLDLIEGLDEPLYFMGSAAVIGIPGAPDSIYLTRMGPIAGAPVSLDETVLENRATPDPLAPGNAPDSEYDRLKETHTNNPVYTQLKQQAGNQPTANTQSQSNDSFKYNSTNASGVKQNLVTSNQNQVAPSSTIPDNRKVNNPHMLNTMPSSKTVDKPPSTRKKNRPTPKGRLKRKVTPGS